MILRLGWLGLILASLPLGASEAPDLRALAKQARPAVYLLAIQDEDGEVKSSGTGFLVSPDGLLVTNHHVVTGAKHILAKAENGGLFPVTRIIASDPANDLALLQVEGKDLPYLSLAPPNSAEAGTRIAVIGSPLGLEGTLTEGIVSARRKLPGETREVLQISAAISQGSSPGAGRGRGILPPCRGPEPPLRHPFRKTARPAPPFQPLRIPPFHRDFHATPGPR
ncbi:MAG: hypothetical protein EBT68_04245 [Verrucomicrobia bacterium]|nr:hypothetical protein [Verrucomicrobiota bacterium]